MAAFGRPFVFEGSNALMRCDAPSVRRLDGYFAAARKIVSHKETIGHPLMHFGVQSKNS
jgi:hypothetical protein